MDIQELKEIREQARDRARRYEYPSVKMTKKARELSAYAADLVRISKAADDATQIASERISARLIEQSKLVLKDARQLRDEAEEERVIIRRLANKSLPEWLKKAPG